MSVEWNVKSEIVHHSRASWSGPKPKDGGFALLKEAFDWIRDNRTPGKLVVNFGTGGSASDLEFIQSEPTPTPAADEEETLEPFGSFE